MPQWRRACARAHLATRATGNPQTRFTRDASVHQVFLALLHRSQLVDATMVGREAAASVQPEAERVRAFRELGGGDNRGPYEIRD